MLIHFAKKVILWVCVGIFLSATLLPTHATADAQGVLVAGLFGRNKPNKNQVAKSEQAKPPATLSIQSTEESEKDEELLTPIGPDGETKSRADSEVDPSNSQQDDANSELKDITSANKQKVQDTIDVINFIQPSLKLSKEEQEHIDAALTRAEQEQLILLWRATLERNKTINFIVQKLAPTANDSKKNQVLSQVLNTAIFLPFYAIQSVAPANTGALASYLGAGLASDIIAGKARKNNDKLLLTQTEMVIMFMMIDQVAERVRDQYHLYKQERTDLILAQNEVQEARNEARALLGGTGKPSPEAIYLSQVRIRQLEREMRRIDVRLRSNRIVLVDLAGPEAVAKVDEFIAKELAALLSLPEFRASS